MLFEKNGQSELNFALLNKVKQPVLHDLASFVDPMKPTFAQAPFPTTVGLSNPVVVEYNNTGSISGEKAPSYVNQTFIINVTNVDDPNSPNHRGSFNKTTFDTSTLDKPALFKALLGENLPKSLNPIVINGFGSDYVSISI